MPTKPTISVIINTRNEADNIIDCVASAQWADEVIAVDQHSDDDTATLAKKLGAKVFLFEHTGVVEPARNFAISKATSDWLFVLDADERIPKPLAAELRRLSQSTQHDTYLIAEKNIVFGEWIQHGTLWPDYHIRFFKAGSLAWPTGVHERPAPTSPPGVIAAREELALQHFSRSYQTVSGFIDAYFGRYSIFDARAMHERTDYTFRRRHIILIPWREFRLRFFTTKGYRDGWHGLMLAFLFAAYRVVTVVRYWDEFRPPIPQRRYRTSLGYLLNLFTDRT